MGTVPIYFRKKDYGVKTPPVVIVYVVDPVLLTNTGVAVMV